MMTADEYRKQLLIKNIVVVILLCLCIVGVGGAVYYYRTLDKTAEELKLAKNNLQQRNTSLTAATDSLNRINSILQVLRDTLARQKDNYANLLTSNNPAAIKQAAESIGKSRDSAREYARVGYRKLKEKDFDGARLAFNKSEKFYNGYRDSYDVYFLLWKNRDGLKDPVVQRSVMQQVLTKYNSLQILSKSDLP